MNFPEIRFKINHEVSNAIKKFLLMVEKFYISKRERSRDIFIVYQDGFQDMVFKTTRNKSVNSFHSEM